MFCFICIRDIPNHFPIIASNATLSLFHSLHYNVPLAFFIAQCEQTFTWYCMKNLLEMS